MKLAIVFDTRTGNTAAAAERMAELVRSTGHEAIVESVSRADPKVVARADAVVLAGWTKGWFIIRQHPSEGILSYCERLTLNGRPTAVVMTYRLAVGSAVTQMARAAESAGGKVTGMFAVKGPKAPDGFVAWVESLGTSL
jgi:flavodoxin